LLFVLLQFIFMSVTEVVLHFYVQNTILPFEFDDCNNNINDILIFSK